MVKRNEKIFLSQARRDFHAALLKNGLLQLSDKGVPSNADKDSRISVAIAKGILDKIGESIVGSKLAGQVAGADFEKVCQEFVDLSFRELAHLRPGHWTIARSKGKLGIAAFDQYSHLDELEVLAEKHSELRTALGSDYLIKPDITISRHPEPDENLNSNKAYVDGSVAKLTPLRLVNNERPILHASISCKWTLRSDRAQNARSEGLTLVKNRKGRLPHIVLVTAEPTPGRISSIALGTGEVDCVYHFALTELQEVVREQDLADSIEILDTMIKGKRLRDIADLPIDLAM